MPDNSPSNAAHLLRRAAWGGRPEEIEAAVDAGIDATVDALLDASDAPTVGEPMRDPEVHSYSIDELMSWFVRLCATSPTPAIERLTWFWSGHFATSVEKVEWADLMHRQYVTCRRLGLGRFDELLKAITRDPAMIIFLDLDQSIAGRPNENFARELLELFTMGASNGYTQDDVVAAARALTGHGVEFVYERPAALRLNPGTHDHGRKTFLGRSGNFDGDDIIDIVTERRECHEFIARRFWLRYAGTTASPAIVARLADAFGDRLRIDDLLRTMWTLDAFYENDVTSGLVSQPFEVLIRTVRGFDLPLWDSESIHAGAAEDDEDGPFALEPWFVADNAFAMGQPLGVPPNVAGWPHNEPWLDSNRAASRLVAGVALGHLIADLDLEVSETLRQRAHDPDALASSLFERFGVVDVSSQTVDAITAATRGLAPIESVASAFAVAFTSPEVTLA